MCFLSFYGLGFERQKGLVKFSNWFVLLVHFDVLGFHSIGAPLLLLINVFNIKKAW